jgi:hypothetical protein
MELSYYEIVDLERFLGTLESCDYLGVAPKLSDQDAMVLGMMHGKMSNWLRTFSRGD